VGLLVTNVTEVSVARISKNYLNNYYSAVILTIPLF